MKKSSLKDTNDKVGMFQESKLNKPLDLAELTKFKADTYDENNESFLEYGCLHDSGIKPVFATFVFYKHPNYQWIDERQTLLNFKAHIDDLSKDL